MPLLSEGNIEGAIGLVFNYLFGKLNNYFFGRLNTQQGKKAVLSDETERTRQMVVKWKAENSLDMNKKIENHAWAHVRDNNYMVHEMLAILSEWRSVRGICMCTNHETHGNVSQTVHVS